MSFGQYTASDEKRLMALVEEMRGASDRAAAIVGAAWTEEALSSAITHILDDHGEASKRLFSGAGPLASFSAKIDLARLLGIMTDSIYADLHAIRQIRNEFAHQIAHKTEHTRLAFTSGHIRDRCLALRCVQAERHIDPRSAYTRACATLNADFDLVGFFGVKLTDGGRVFAKGVDDEVRASSGRK